MSESSFMHLVRPNVIAPAAGAANGPAKITIHTPAYLTILEIVSKQVLGKRTIGSLLGVRSDDGLEIEIRDAFMIPITETGDSIAIEEQSHKVLYQLYKKAHPKESVLGWFGSASQIDDTTSLIHDFYSKGVDRAFPHPAIYLNVEYLDSAGKPTAPKVTTYIGAAVGKPVSKTNVQIGWNKTANINNSYIFTPIPNEIFNGTTTEKIAFKTLQEATLEKSRGSSSPTQASELLNGDLSYLSVSIQETRANVEDLLKYIDSQSQNSTSDDNIDLLRKLSNSLLTKPPILSNVDELNKAFESHNQDVIMIELMTKAVKEQIETSAKLTAASEAEKRY
ncbi:hypothetical protein PVL30_004954 [Lodderomyces elongisporus]|uniref:MPN domain-containing protein n=1 Tax=Lodderomyces elongisporus (strain ATCC 11503 / CBS 2605 / JCM 1781 / NBRC 1676 / NRRL YB-4239) TaxID=379508 RepID=A5E3F2_LODEL|nr:uncharacterized protein PVL30_004954 [Lodderomyces elongisporus]EDK45960.1 conserved hypothetical protein [Lodderomyces elongisporus NRRL YB-4239]WLF81157.1 hypothetical protein PVL30_004954 [Lodderomyces elongisporus]